MTRSPPDGTVCASCWTRSWPRRTARSTTWPGTPSPHRGTSAGRAPGVHASHLLRCAGGWCWSGRPGSCGGAPASPIRLSRPATNPSRASLGRSSAPTAGRRAQRRTTTCHVPGASTGCRRPTASTSTRRCPYGWPTRLCVGAVTRSPRSWFTTTWRTPARCSRWRRVCRTSSSGVRGHPGGRSCRGTARRNPWRAVLEHLVWTTGMAGLDRRRRAPTARHRRPGQPAGPARRRRSPVVGGRAGHRPPRGLGRPAVDALCDPPETFVLGSVIAHVITFSAHRRQLLRHWLRRKLLSPLL